MITLRELIIHVYYRVKPKELRFDSPRTMGFFRAPRATSSTIPGLGNRATSSIVPGLGPGTASVWPEEACFLCPVHQNSKAFNWKSCVLVRHHESNLPHNLKEAEKQKKHAMTPRDILCFKKWSESRVILLDWEPAFLSPNKGILFPEQTMRRWNVIQE